MPADAMGFWERLAKGTLGEAGKENSGRGWLGRRKPLQGGRKHLPCHPSDLEHGELGHRT